MRPPRLFATRATAAARLCARNVFLITGGVLTLLVYLWELPYRTPTTGLGAAVAATGAVATLLVPPAPRAAWLIFQVSDAVAVCAAQHCGPVPSPLVPMLFALGIIAYRHPLPVATGYVLASTALQICAAMAPGEHDLSLADVPSFAAMFLAAALIGGSLRTHDRLMRERLHAERTRAQLEALRRNTRLAQSIHDSVTGDLSFIARLSRQRQAAPGTPSDAEAWSSVNAAATAALQRTYRVIDSLDEATQPQQGDPTQDGFVGSLHAAVDRGDQSAQALGLRGHGTIHVLAHAPLDDAAQALVTDTVRELYANILRHACPDAPYSLSVMIDGDGVQITQINRIGDDDTTLRSGHGLTMLRRRIEQAHGSMTARRDGEDWTVYAVVPVTA